MTDEKITIFAKTNFRNREVPFGIKRDDRRRHMYLIGKTGMGKTTMMENMAIQDIRNGHGLAFLDPHGDSVQRILDCIPSSRINDVVYFNPADLEYPIAFNILEAVDSKYKHLVASGLMGVFTKIWANVWSARMEYILNNTVLALLDSPGNTLLGITRMYVDKKYRKKIIDNIKDPIVRAFWVDEFANYNDKYRTEAIAPIQNKVGQFLSSAIVRNIVGQPKSTIDLREVMDQRKILIMDLSKGKVGEDNSALLGAMIVTKLQLAAMSRTDMPEEERKDFYLYVDEFQNFATDSFATILSEARKYRLNLIVGHQYIAQLENEKSTKVRDAIFGNVGTIVVFRIGAADAEFMETEFDPIFTPNDMVNLPKYNIILKLMINGVASEPFSAVTIPSSPEYFTGNAEKVIKVSRERYTNQVDIVEDKIARWMGADFHEGTVQLTLGATEQLENSEPVRPEPIREPLTPPLRTIDSNSLPLPIKPVEDKTPLQPEPQAESGKLDQAMTPATPTAPIAEPNFTPAGSPENESRPRPPALTTFKSHHSSRPEPQNSRRSHSPNRPGSNQKNSHHNSPNHKHRQPEKKSNPIWDKVLNLQHQKIQEKSQQIKQTIFSLESQPQEPKPQASQPAPAPVSEPIVNSNKNVLQPGEKMKF
jgi:hypothetical protein